MARATLTIEVPTEFLEQRIEEFWAETTEEERAGRPKPTADEWLRERLQDVCDDELRVAMWSWPIEAEIVSVDV